MTAVLSVDSFLVGLSDDHYCHDTLLKDTHLFSNYITLVMIPSVSLSLPLIFHAELTILSRLRANEMIKKEMHFLCSFSWFSRILDWLEFLFSFQVMMMKKERESISQQKVNEWSCKLFLVLMV